MGQILIQFNLNMLGAYSGENSIGSASHKKLFFLSPAWSILPMWSISLILVGPLRLRILFYGSMMYIQIHTLYLQVPSESQLTC